jgi:DNA polymerase III sliding clamp (beta) subunit (PCNA family)
MQVPANSKIEKAVSKDQARPVLTDPALVIDESGETPAGYLCATDSYKLVMIPVELEAGDVAGPVPLEAVKAAIKDCHGHVHANGSAALPDGRSYPRPNGQFPNALALMPTDDPTTKRFEVGVSAKYLADVAAAMGTETVRLSFLVTDEGIQLRPILVTPLHGSCARGSRSPVEGAKAIVMPIRLSS